MINFSKKSKVIYIKSIGKLYCYDRWYLDSYYIKNKNYCNKTGVMWDWQSKKSNLLHLINMLSRGMNMLHIEANLRSFLGQSYLDIEINKYYLINKYLKHKIYRKLNFNRKNMEENNFHIWIYFNLKKCH